MALNIGSRLPPGYPSGWVWGTKDRRGRESGPTWRPRPGTPPELGWPPNAGPTWEHTSRGMTEHPPPEGLGSPGLPPLPRDAVGKRGEPGGGATAAAPGLQRPPPRRPPANSPRVLGRAGRVWSLRRRRWLAGAGHVRPGRSFPDSWRLRGIRRRLPSSAVRPSPPPPPSSPARFRPAYYPPYWQTERPRRRLSACVCSQAMGDKKSPTR